MRETLHVWNPLCVKPVMRESLHESPPFDFLSEPFQRQERKHQEGAFYFAEIIPAKRLQQTQLCVNSR